MNGRVFRCLPVLEFGKTAAFDLQLNPAQPSLQLHRIDKSKDRNFWSARVNLDLRLICRLRLLRVHRISSDLFHRDLCITRNTADRSVTLACRKLASGCKPENKSCGGRPCKEDCRMTANYLPQFNKYVARIVVSDECGR